MCTRHGAIAKVVFEECQAAALNPVLEMPFLIPNTIKRPGDVVVSGLHRGKLQP